MRVIVVAAAVVAAVLGVGLESVLVDGLCLKNWDESIDLAGDGGSVVVAVEEVSDFGERVSWREISWMGDNFDLVFVESVFLSGVGLERGWTWMSCASFCSVVLFVFSATARP